MTPQQSIRTAIVIGAGVIAGAWWLQTSSEIDAESVSSAVTAPARLSAPSQTTTAGAMPPAAAPVSVATPIAAPAVAATATASLGTQAQATLQAFDDLRQLPPGDSAIALSRQLEAGLTPANASGYVQALLTTDSPAVERAAISALARSADADTMRTLADAYGNIPAEHRGRVLQVLEGAANPGALDGLTAIVAADTSEKRSPLVMSAMYGIANVGTPESLQYLFSQLTPDSADFALMALQKVQSPQGMDIIRSAAAGNKDTDSIAPAFLPAVRQIAANAPK